MKRVLIPVGVALVLVALLSATVGAQTLKTVFDGVVADWIITIDDVTVGDDLTVTDAAAVGGALTVAGAFNAVGNSSTNGTFGATSSVAAGTSVSAGTFLKATNQGNLTVTEGGVLTPTGTFQGLTAAGSVSTGQVALVPSGSVFTLINFGSNTITLTETATLVTSGNLALGQYDNATFISDGTRWILLSTTNN